MVYVVAVVKRGPKALYIKEYKVRGGKQLLNRNCSFIPLSSYWDTVTSSLSGIWIKVTCSKQFFFSAVEETLVQWLIPPDSKSVIPEIPHGKTSYQLATYFYCGKLVKSVGLFIAAASCTMTQFSSAHFSCSVMSNSAISGTSAHQASLFINKSQSLLKLMSIE